MLQRSAVKPEYVIKPLVPFPKKLKYFHGNGLQAAVFFYKILNTHTFSFLIFSACVKVRQEFYST